MEKKILEAFSMAPLAVELDRSGYADPNELMVLQKARMDLRLKCEDLALRYLKLHPSPIAAKNKANADIRRVEAGTTPVDPDEDLSVYFDFVRAEVDQAIERESLKSEWRRNLSRFLLLIPGAFRVAALLLVGAMITFAVWDVIG